MIITTNKVIKDDVHAFFSSLTDEQMFPNLFSSVSLLNNISSTREFEIGHQSILFTNVSLLMHGKLK